MEKLPFKEKHRFGFIVAALSKTRKIKKNLIFLAHYSTFVAASGAHLSARNQRLGLKMVPKWSPGVTVFLPKWPADFDPAHFWAPPGPHLARQGAPGRSKRAQRHPKRSNSTTLGLQNGRPRAPNTTKNRTRRNQDKTRQDKPRQERTGQKKRQDTTRQGPQTQPATQ